MKGRCKRDASISQSPGTIRSNSLRNSAAHPRGKGSLDVLNVQKYLRTKLSPCSILPYQTLPTFPLYEKHLKHLYCLIEKTVKYGESNSLLVVGPQGCGKTAMVRNVTENMLRDQEIKSNLLIVELNGLVHTDDSIALRDISRQLKLGNVVDNQVFGSVAEHLRFVLEALRGSDQHSKSILFVLEAFELFCQHKNQTLLYNIFDVAQSAQAPIVVVGLTTRLDVIELLEKRVKSRFSHRQLHLFNEITFEQYVLTGQWYLTLPDDFSSNAVSWNQDIVELFNNKVVVDSLKRIFDSTKDFSTLKKFLFLPACSLSEKHTKIVASDFVDALKLLSTDSKSVMINGLSVLELTLIVTMVNYTASHFSESFNFNIIYTEYKKLTLKKSGLKDFERAVVQKAFEHLENLELIRCIDRGACRLQKEYVPMKLLVEPIQIQESLQQYPNLPTDLQQLASAILSALY